MPELDIGASQAEYLEELREALADECLEGYGAMRPRDALQYLIDRHEATRPADDLVPDARATTDSDDGTDSMAANSTGTPNERGASSPSIDDAAAAMSDVTPDAETSDATTSVETVRTDDPAPADGSAIDETTPDMEQAVEETRSEGVNAETSRADGDAETSRVNTDAMDADTATADRDTDDASTADVEAGTTEETDTTTTTTDPAPSPSGSGSPLRQMMELLEEHDDKWEETASSDGKYVVTLPDGSNEHARTRDDVRALLFKHYR